MKQRLEVPNLHQGTVGLAHPRKEKVGPPKSFPADRKKVESAVKTKAQGQQSIFSSEYPKDKGSTKQEPYDF